MGEFEQYLKREHGCNGEVFINQFGSCQYLRIKNAFEYQQSKIEGLEKKLGALNLLLANWNDEYTQNTTNHETQTDAVLRTCITELNRILRGES